MLSALGRKPTPVRSTEETGVADARSQLAPSLSSTAHPHHFTPMTGAERMVQVTIEPLNRAFVAIRPENLGHIVLSVE